MTPNLLNRRPATLVALSLTFFLWLGLNHAAEQREPASAPGASQTEVASLRAEIERLKGLVPDQSHAMKDVAYHFSNLWFAAQKTNWPLAEFYWSETRSHLRWAVRIIPVRKDPQGHEIHLPEILEPIEKGALQKLGNAISAKDNVRFVGTYKEMLESCFACHLAAGKTFLKLRVPERPETSIVRFDPTP